MQGIALFKGILDGLMNYELVKMYTLKNDFTRRYHIGDNLSGLSQIR